MKVAPPCRKKPPYFVLSESQSRKCTMLVTNATRIRYMWVHLYRQFYGYHILKMSQSRSKLRFFISLKYPPARSLVRQLNPSSGQ